MTLQRPGTPSAGERRCVLIVDEDSVFTLHAGETLERAGWRVSVAGDFASALDQFAGARPDIVLLAAGLAGNGGFEICARIRRAAGGLDVPIIMVTAHDDTESLTRAYEAGATDFLSKPFLWRTLPHRMNFLLRAGNHVQALKRSEHKNRTLLEGLPDSIFIADADGIILDRIAGNETPHDHGAVGSRLGAVLPPSITEALKNSSPSAAAMGEMSTYEFVTGKGPEQRAFEARVRPQADGTFLIVIRDATERRRAEARIEYLAYYDTLTGLPNRQLFVRDVSRAISDAERRGRLLAVLHLDLDRFKRINDNLGHSVGDALLKSVARRLEQSLRASDSISRPGEGTQRESGRIARLGGDEFVISLTGMSDEAQVASVAGRLQQALREPFECEGNRFVITPSIGISLYPQDGSDVEDLLVKADMAMYQAKNQGGNGHAFYGNSMAVRSLSRLELENDLHQALEANDFQVYYQPKMDLATGMIIGVEALLRWHHAERGWVSPEKFIPVAEETGMIVALGDWVISETCKQLKIWAGGELAYLSIAVNVSVQQFVKEDFVESVLRSLWRHGIKPQQLELEITESLLMRNIASTTVALKKLGDAGLTLSIDDFGTGYSSLGYLRQFPVDALKIDRSFVKDLHGSKDDAAICAAIIAMARELKLKVIAEGVETTEQLDFLRKHRCDQAQGYLISKPISAAELENLLRPGPDARPIIRARARQRD